MRTTRPSEQEVEIARVYARALLGLAERRGESEGVGQELAALASLLDRSPELDRYLASPLTDAGERGRTLDRVFGGRMSDLLLDTLQVMNRKGRMALGRALEIAYREEFEALKGIVEVHVRSAVALAEETRSRLREAAARHTGKRVLLRESVDESLIGGLVVRVGDRKIDTSVANGLRKLGARLLERASREIQGGAAARFGNVNPEEST